MINRKLYYVLLIVPLLSNLISSKKSKCDDLSWPVYVSSGYNDTSNCLAYDKTNRLMIVGGTSQDISDDNPLMNKTGFVYALDVDGNWMWSHTFLDGSNSLSEINQCAMSSDSKSSVVYGMLNG